jgi:hypothetical protein
MIRAAAGGGGSYSARGVVSFFESVCRLQVIVSN